MVNKVLFCATVDYHFKAFHLPYMKWFKEQGFQVDIAASGQIDLPYVDQKYDIPIKRSPFHKNNVTAFKQLKQIILENDYAIIHCHTPLGGVLARLAAKKARKQGTKVIYTAHGFHFCKGAPLLNWLLYYPIEKYLSRYTDILITINQEDFHLATKKNFKARAIKLIHGVGVDTSKFRLIDPHLKRGLKESFGYQEDDFLLFNAAEFNKNKNQQHLIYSLALIKDEFPHVKLLLAGEGPLLAKCQTLANQLGVDHMVDFLGFRKDIKHLLQICDVAVASSFREGLPVNVMEAMACGLPVVAVDNRGHRDLIDHGVNGVMISTWNPFHFAHHLKILVADNSLRQHLGARARQLMESKFSTQQILSIKSEVYQGLIENQEEVTWAIE